MNQFNHLHVHSHASIMRSIIKIDQLLDKVEEMGHKSVAVTNNANLFDSIEFYQKAKKRGIKPILGCEFYIVDDLEIKEKNENITILAMSDEGWKNLKILVTLANKEGFYRVPRIDYEMLFKHSDGLICMSGGIYGKLSRLILEQQLDEAEEFCVKLKETFGDRLYLELMSNDVPGQAIVRKELRDLGYKLNIPCVYTGDCHYIERDSAYIHEVLLAIGSHKTMSMRTSQENIKGRPVFPSNDFYLKDYDDLKEEFSSSELSNTLEIADRCNIDIDFSTIKMPIYPRLPDGINSYNHLRKLIFDGFKLRDISLENKEYVDRVKKELADIKDAELADYFLIVWDFIKWSKDRDIRIGAGRGSAGGSLVAYLLNITNIDPIKYGLIWERFYNIGRRGSLPDIDTDIEIEKRDDILQYIIRTFGEDNVCQMITFNRLTTKSVLKDVGKAFDVDFKTMNEITRYVPFKTKNLKGALKESDNLRRISSKYKKIFVIAEQLEGLIKSRGSHAAAVVITNEKISEGCLPMNYDAANKKITTGFDMYDLDALLYLKLDLLGLKTLSVIKYCEALINEKN